MTREFHPAIEISRWLTRECGIPFKEAAEARMKALAQLRMSVYQHSQLSQANLNVYRTKLVEEKKAVTNAKRQATRLANKNLKLGYSAQYEDYTNRQPSEVVPQIEIKDACVSCGSETFECSCEIKTTTDIPF